MFKKFRKISKNQKGFTLTEVLIGIMILSVAIVTGSNLLVSIIKSNQIATTTLQAHYLAQEGLEAVRNMRDTNWLHNEDWLDGRVYKILDSSEDSGSFAVQLNPLAGGQAGTPSGDVGIYLSGISPWKIDGAKKIGLIENVAGKYFGPYTNNSIDTGFSREIFIEPYEDCGIEPLDGETLCEDFVLARSLVTWQEGSVDREYELSMVLSDWKGGAL